MECWSICDPFVWLLNPVISVFAWELVKWIIFNTIQTFWKKVEMGLKVMVINFCIDMKSQLTDRVPHFIINKPVHYM